MSQYRYFVSYTCQAPPGAAPMGTGHADVTLPNPIRSGADVARVTQFLEQEHGLTKVTIINFQRFDDA